jgi:hypothetical protein
MRSDIGRDSLNELTTDTFFLSDTLLFGAGWPGVLIVVMSDGRRRRFGSCGT